MKQYLIDAFASVPFMGNPACVLAPFEAWPETAWMQRLAMENNQAETAFLLKTDDPARFGLRWFTPALEVPLCGHATLASAHMLYAHLGLDTPAITFETKSGPLTVSRLDDGRLEMNFPAGPPVLAATPEGLSEAIGVPILETWLGPYVVAWVKDEATVRAAVPNGAEIKRICQAPPLRERGNLIVAAFADKGSPFDVVSRFFAPGSGIAEDPATGSAHCILSPLFAQKTGKTNGRFFQAYPGRGGEIDCELKADRVLLRGKAVTVLVGDLLI